MRIKLLIGVIQAIALVTLLLTPIIWIWDTWSLAWRIGLTALIVVLICKILYAGVEDALKRK